MSAYDVAIIGAGPAGSAAARLLSSWNHRVVVLHRPAGAAASLAESIPPSCRKLFHACDVLKAIDEAGFYRSTGNTVWWGSEDRRREWFGRGAMGYQVERRVFDEVLRREAVRAGAELHETFVRDVRRESGAPGAQVMVRGDTEAGARVVHARFVLDCSGRSGVIARRRWRTDVPGHPHTVALVAIWSRTSGWRDIEPTHTLVESYDDGWVWSVPVSPGLRYVTAMVDPQRTRLARGRAALAVYDAELGKTRHLSALIRESRLERAPWGCAASVYAAHTYAEDPMLLVGDAASFIDPLSSYGVKKAIASAWLAAITVNTALRTPSMTAPALSFFAAREREMATSLLRQSRTQFGTAAAEHPHAFWSDRAAAELPESHEPDAGVLRRDARVQRAFTWLKQQDAIVLRQGAAVRREPHPVIRGREIVLEDRLVTAACPHGLRFLCGLDLAELLTLAAAYEQVPALFDAYNRRCPPCSLADFLGALSVMIAFGLLEDSHASCG